MKAQTQKRIRWQRGLFRIYALWMFISIPLAWRFSRGVYRECRKDASQSRNQAEQIAAAFPDDERWSYGVTNWADKAEKFSQNEWCSTQARLFADPAWYETQIRIIQQRLAQITERAPDEWLSHDEKMAWLADSFLLSCEADTLEARIKKFSSVEWRELQANNFATPEWCQEEARTAREESTRMRNATDEALRLEAQASVIAVGAGWRAYAVIALAPWVVHYVVKLLGLWIISGFVGMPSGSHPTEHGNGGSTGSDPH